jgi:hypothetical protein
VLLVLKDVQWADRSTLELVAFRARRMRGERILSRPPIGLTRLNAGWICGASRPMSAGLRRRRG